MWMNVKWIYTNVNPPWSAWIHWDHIDVLLHVTLASEEMKMEERAKVTAYTYKNNFQ